MRDKGAEFENEARGALRETLKQVGLMSKSSILVLIHLFQPHPCEKSLCFLVCTCMCLCVCACLSVYVCLS